MNVRFHDEGDSDLDAMYGDLAQADLQPLWKQEGLLPLSPRTITPHIWRWDTVKPLAERAGRLVDVTRGGDRRVLALAHPDLLGKPFATPTLWAGIQFLNGHESAPPHRHTPAALRFVMEGSGVWTLVNGDPVLMQSGDLVLTPSLNWHAHDNPGDDPMVWFDGLDLPLVQSLDAVFFENGPEELAPYAARLRSAAEASFASPGLRPPTPVLPKVHNDGLASPLLAYRWSATDAALDALLAETGEPSALLRYSNPTTGGDVMPTLRAQICRIRAAGHVPAQRKVGSSVVLVHQGRGESVVGGTRVRWQRGDVFVVPSWTAAEHSAEQESTLFELSDAPLIEMAGLGRVEGLA